MYLRRNCADDQVVKHNICYEECSVGRPIRGDLDTTLGDWLQGADSFALIAVFSKYSNKMDRN